MYEANHYLRILDGKEWCVDSPANPSVGDVLAQLENQNQKWLGNSTALETKAYRDEIEDTKRELGDWTSLEAQHRQAIKTIEDRLETYLEEVFSTRAHHAGKPFLRDYTEGMQKKTQLDSIALSFRCSRDFVLDKARALGIEVRTAPSFPPDPQQAVSKDAGASPPSWVWDAARKEVRSKFSITDWNTPRDRLPLIPGSPEDLYRFLGKTSSAGVQELLDAKQDAVGLWDSDHAPGKTANQNEWGKKLCASVDVWLGTESDKALYDAMLRLDHGGVLDFLWDELNQWPDLVDGVSVISDELWEEAVRRVRKNALSDDEAEWLVWYQLTRKKKCKCLPPDISGLLGEIARHLAANRFRQAKEAAEKALKKSPKDETVKRYLADAEAGLEAERKAAAAVAAANDALQGLLDAGKVKEACTKLDEVSGQRLAGFDAGQWREKIKRVQKRQDFQDAVSGLKWDLAEAISQELVDMGEGTPKEWKGKIEQAKKDQKQTLTKGREAALAAFATAVGRGDVEGAREELRKAKDAQGKLHAQFGEGATVARITGGEKKLEDLEKRLALEGLKPVRELAAEGSADGSPVVRVAWKAAGDGTQAAAWRVFRRKKGGGGEGVPLGDVRRPGYEDRGGSLKVGVEYEYGVVPLVEEAGSGGQKVLKANKQAAAWSGAAVCRAKLAADALSGRGEGEAGQWGLVALSWRLPAGLEIREGNVKLKLSRSDGWFRDKDVTGRVGFEDDAVEVGRSYEYTLELSIAGQASGRSAARVAVATQPPPEAVRELRARRLPGGRSFSGGSMWLATWEWPAGGDRVLLVQSEGELAGPERSALA